jgi:cell division protein FtsW
MARMPDSVVFVPLRANRNGRRLLVTTFALLAIGVIMVHSAMTSVGTPGAWYSRPDVRHTIFAGLAGVVLLLGWLVDYRAIGKTRVWGLRGIIERRTTWAFIILLVSFMLAWLVYIPGIGHSVGGYHRWIRLGPSSMSLGFQPSELIKIALVVFLASWLSGKTPEDLRSFKRTFVPAMIMLILAIAPVVKEDLGTAAVLLMIGTVTMLLAGVPLRHFIAPAVMVGGMGFLFVMNSPHRLARITVMNDVWSTGNPTAYQPRQSLLAILTGGWYGKGIGAGTLKLGFLPEDSTDFIFSALCEEWGVVGALILLGLVVLWIRHVWQISLEASDRFGQVLAAGLGFLIAAQALLHVGVDTVVLPPTGMSMPFVSAGGTSLLLMAGAVAMIISVSARRNVKDPLR